MAKLVSLEQAAGMIPDGASVMVGGFMGCGSPHRLIDAIVAKGTKGLTVYCNDAGSPGYGVAKLISAGLESAQRDPRRAQSGSGGQDGIRGA